MTVNFMLDLTPLVISLKTATVATLINLGLGIAAARWMWRSASRYKSAIELVFLAPLVLPPTVVGFILLLLLGRNSLLGKLLELLDIRIVFTWLATVIAAVVVSFPLIYKTALSAFNQVDAKLIDCARTLGASEKAIFWRVLLPLSKSGLIAGTLLSFARALGEFGATLMLAGSIPGKTETMPIAIYLAAESGATDRAFLLVILMLVIAGIVISLVNYWEGKGLKRSPRYSFQRSRNSYFQNRSQGFRQVNKPIPSSDILSNLTVNIQKQLGDFFLDVNFSTNQQPLGLLGASGSGKTTILRCIAGLETPDFGYIILNGQTLFDSAQKINLSPQERHCGLLFQDYALFPHLTVAENISFGMDRRLSRLQVCQEVQQQLAKVELSGMDHRYPNQLSGGQQQRVALARIQASNPEILLLDEPFSALDTYLRHQQEKLLRQSLTGYSGITLFITHNLEEAYRVCQKLLVIDRGQKIAFDHKTAVFKRSPNFRTAQVTNCKNFSPGIVINQQQVKAIAWDCLLDVADISSLKLNPQELTKPNTENLPITIGIRAHQILIDINNPEAKVNPLNCFDCWLASYSETQHRVTCYLKLHQAATHQEDYHLQAEVSQDSWSYLQNHAFPWRVYLRPERIMVFDN
ncbi:MAG: molybdate ABC transporter permease subunit [Cyanobacteria bacterium J06642_3]